jgi:hypothetical protein
MDDEDKIINKFNHRPPHPHTTGGTNMEERVVGTQSRTLWWLGEKE